MIAPYNSMYALKGIEMYIYIGGVLCTINKVIDSTKVEIFTPMRTNPVPVGSVDVKIEVVLTDTSYINYGKTIILSSKILQNAFSFI